MKKQARLDALVSDSRQALDAGERDAALAAARAAVALSPNSIDALLCLANALTFYGLYRFDPAFAATLIDSGALAEAVQIRTRLVSLGVEETDNFLQLGYCLTFLQDFPAATINIGRAADLFVPGVNKAPSDLARGAERMAPRFHIIGAAKCGTTSLFEYISQHPLVLPPVVKEIDYFLHPERGRDWFHAHFPRRPLHDIGYITGEASVSTISLATAPQEMRSMNPSARLIALARDPVDRAVSHYANNVRLGVEKRSLNDAIDQELDILESSGTSRDDDYWVSQQGYIWQGLYAQDLQRWQAVFPDDQLCIIITEDMQRHHQETMSRVFRFLGLPQHDVSGFVKHNSGSYDRQDQTRARARMKAFFARPNEHFFELIGRRLDWGGPAAPLHGPLVPRANQARVLMLKGQWKEAAEAFQDCLAGDPGHPERQEWLEQRCIACIEAKDMNGARETLSALTSAFPGSAILPAMLGRFAERVNDPMESARILEDCISRYPDHADHRQWLLWLGRMLIQARRWERAEQVFQIIASAYPGESGGVFGLARVAEESGKGAHAAALFDIYLKRFPEDPERRWRLIIVAHALLRHNHLARAEQIITRYRADFPQEAGGLACNALLEQQKGNRKRAIAIWNECLGRYPDHPDRLWWLPTLTNLVIESGDLGRADELIDEMLIAFPTQPGGLVCLARVAAGRGDSRRAAEIWEECLSRFPHHPERRWWLPTYGHALLNEGRTDQGEAQFRTALAEFPGDPIATSGLARAFGDRGQWEQAAQLLRTCIANNPGHPLRSEWDSRLNNAETRMRSQPPQPKA